MPRKKCIHVWDIYYSPRYTKKELSSPCIVHLRNRGKCQRCGEIVAFLKISFRSKITQHIIKKGSLRRGK